MPSDELHLMKESIQLWSQGHMTLREIKKYSYEEMGAIAQLGYLLIMQGKNPEAQILFEGLSALDPKNEYYYRALGVIFQRLGEYQKAIRQFSYAMKVSPSCAHAYVNRAEIFLSLREFNRAEEDLRMADSLIPQAQNPLKAKVQSLLLLLSRAEI